MAFIRSFGAVTEYLRSFGALSQVDEDEVQDKPQWKVRKDPNVNRDIESESTDAGSDIQQSISHDDYQQLYRRLSILQSSSKPNVCPEECQPMAQNSSENSDKDKARQDAFKLPKRKMKTPVANARRWCCFTKIFSEPEP